MQKQQESVGKVVKYSGLNVWPHEQVIADILAADGHIVEFIKPADRKGENTPDVLMDGIRWEFKSPKSSKLDAVERNLKRASRQCSRIVFASRRMKRVPDKAIERELSKQLNVSKKIDLIKFINRHGKTIDIK